MGVILMRVILILAALSLSAQDVAPDTTPDERASIFQAQRDTLAVIAQANQAVQQAQKREADAVAKVEQRAGCKLDLRTAHCQKVEAKK